ncbi:MAG: tetratricopeptide repeat protein, partial [Proteobacteria bacterium]|nr:tetratricopeptide repeat protein [Pseudomonadota bacterium]
LAGANNARARAEKGLQTNRRIRELLRTPGAEFSREMEELLRENEEISKSLQAFSDSQPLMVTYLSKELNFIGQADYVHHDARVTRAKSIRTGLKRNRLIIEATLRAARNFRRRLPPLIEFFQDMANAEELLGADPDSFLGHLAKGRVLAGVGRHALAARHFEAALESRPRSRRPLLALAKSLLALEEHAPARGALERLLALAPGHAAAGRLLSGLEADLSDLARRAEEARAREDWVSVQTYARKVLAARPDDRATRDLMAWAESVRAERMTQDQEAMDRISETRGRRRRFDADFEEGKEHFQAGRYAEAIEPLARAADRDDLDEDRQASIMLGCARGETGDVAGAEEILLRVMDEHPDWLFPMLNLGRVYLRHGRTEDGLDHLARAAAGSPSYAHHFLEIGDVRFQQGRYRAALEAFQSCSRALPGSYEARYKIGLCQLALGRPQSARQTLSDVLRMKPDFGPAMLALNRIDQKMAEAAGRAGEVG